MALKIADEWLRLSDIEVKDLRISAAAG